MTNKRARKKLNRAAPQYPPGGGLMYVPVGQQQGVLGQTFYGNTMKNIPVGQSSLFSPGVPLPPQPNVDPQGKPVQFRFPVAYNTYAVDRTMGSTEIPSFEQLRRLSKMYSGITLNERYWLDLVPRMTLDIRLKKMYVDAGAEAKNYQSELKELKTFWEKPDGRHDFHTWIRMGLREQSQIDELYWYKNRTRGKKLLGLWIVAGDQMKPLLDNWGMQPGAPDFAFQQYPWGIPGMQYSTDMMVHYQESPAADTPYGFSRVERVILEVNQALRKKKKDLANFTEGNIPQSFMEVPESLNWTPDQIDSYEQSWNALVAGQAQQQIRMKFLQPGMKYIPAEQYQMLTDFDLFILKVACGVYGVPITEFSFTEDSNRSSGESQEDMVYRRTIGPIALSYAALMTDVMATDFPEQHGEMFEAYFGGYEEIEDEEKKASAITTYTGAGILGLTDAAKMANLPIDPDAVPIGRMMMTQSGPVWLDDVAQPEMRKAQQQATLAGYKMAANPPQPGGQGGAAPASGGNAQQASNEGGIEDESSDNGEDEMNAAMDAAEKSLAALSRSDPVHGYHGEFGAYSGGTTTTSAKGHRKPRTKTPHVKGSPKPKVPLKIRTTTRVAKMALRFAKMAARKIGKKWTSAQRQAASELAQTFTDIMRGIQGGKQGNVDHLLDTAWQQAQRLFGSNFKGLSAMSKALTTIDNANDAGLLRALAAEDEDDDGEDETIFDDLDETLDLFEQESEEEGEISRISEVFANIGEQLRMLNARNVTAEEPELVSQMGTCTCDVCAGKHGRVMATGDPIPPYHDGCGCRIVERSDEHVERTQPSAEVEAGRAGYAGRNDGELIRAGSAVEDRSDVGSGQDHARTVSAEYRRWRDKALKAVSSGKPTFTFVSDIVPRETFLRIQDELQRCTTADEVRAVFSRTREADGSPKEIAVVSGGNQPSSKSAWKLRW